MTMQSISLTKLVPSTLNVRKTGGHAEIEALAASIKAHGLLQNLHVRSCNGSGKFEVIAGGRRLKALKLLVKQKQIDKDVEIDCNVLTDEDATEISLAENIIRLPMHPADQFDAFKAMADAGKGDEEIAARFGCSPLIVRQRLKLASVSPKLIAAYRAEKMSLDQLMAFTVTDDHKAQEECWRSLSEWHRSPQHIRRCLTETHIEADDARVIFAGLKAYIDAGGQVKRDLFQPEHEGWLTDAALLDRLVTERLESEAATVRAEGWKWVETVPHPTWETLRAFDRLDPEPCDLPKRDQNRLARLASEYDALSEDDNADSKHLENLYDQIEALRARESVWLPEQKTIAGAIVGIAGNGNVMVERGLVRPSDRRGARNGQSSGSAGEDAPAEKTPTGLSAALIEDLTAHRTAALQTALAADPHIALATLLHSMLLPLFYNGYGETCVTIRATKTDLSRHGETVVQSKAVKAFNDTQADWAQRLPDQEGLWPWLLAQDDGSLVNLLAVCIAASVNAVQTPRDKSAGQRGEDINRIASALKLDMAQWWEPTASTYLARVPKAKVLEAVTEACSGQAAHNLEKLKKDALCARAEELLSGKGWLPEILRPAS